MSQGLSVMNVSTETAGFPFGLHVNFSSLTQQTRIAARSFKFHQQHEDFALTWLSSEP